MRWSAPLVFIVVSGRSSRSVERCRCGHQDAGRTRALPRSERAPDVADRCGSRHGCRTRGHTLRCRPATARRRRS